METYAPEKKSPLALLEGKKIISRGEYENEVLEREQVLKDISGILSFQKDIGEAKAARIRAESAMESLAPWMSLDIPMNSKGTKKTAVFIGSLPGRWTVEQLMPALAEARPDLDVCSLEILGADRDQTCLFAVTSRDKADILEDALRVNGFVRPPINCGTVPGEYAKTLEQQKEDAVQAEQEAVEKIRSLAGKREK